MSTQIFKGIISRTLIHSDLVEFYVHFDLLRCHAYLDLIVMKTLFGVAWFPSRVAKSALNKEHTVFFVFY